MFGRMRTLGVAMLGAALVSHAAEAKLAGSSIHWQYYAYGGAYISSSSSGDFTVQKQHMTDGTFANAKMIYFKIHSDRDSITFRFAPSTVAPGTFGESQISLPPTIYNGIALTLTSPGSFRSVGVDPATNMVGFNAARVSFSRKRIEVDWQNLNFDASTIVRLDIRVGGTAPAAPAAAAIPGHQQRAAGSNPP